MPYIENRLVHDADSHLMEMSDCLDPYFESSLLKRFLDHPNLGVRVGNRIRAKDRSLGFTYTTLCQKATDVSK